MNRERIEAAIELMKQATNLQMECWQSSDTTSHSIEQLHDCGNTACFAGYLSISPEWQKLGGSVDIYSTPIYKGHMGLYAIAEYLEISEALARSLVHGDLDSYTGWSPFYNVEWRKVEPHHIIAKLELILNGELQ